MTRVRRTAATADLCRSSTSGDADPTQVRAETIIARIAERQWGAFSDAQALGAGMSRNAIRHRLRTGRWERAVGGVLRIAGAPVTWRQHLMVTCLAWGPGAAASHRAAAVLWQLLEREEGPLEVTVPRERRRDGPGVAHRNHLPAADVTVREGIPVTTPTRTLLDLAAVAKPLRVAEALDRALRTRLVTIASLQGYLAPLGRGRPGLRLLRRVLATRSECGVPESVHETRLLEAIIEAQLPMPVVQHTIREGERFVARVDLAYPNARLAIEADGFAFHSGRLEWERDRARANDLVLLGWRIVHVTPTDLARKRDRTMAHIRSALQQAQVV